jgi:hypothetical protein
MLSYGMYWFSLIFSQDVLDAVSASSRPPGVLPGSHSRSCTFPLWNDYCYGDTFVYLVRLSRLQYFLSHLRLWFWRGHFLAQFHVFLHSESCLHIRRLCANRAHDHQYQLLCYRAAIHSTSSNFSRSDMPLHLSPLAYYTWKTFTGTKCAVKCHHRV